MVISIMIWRNLSNNWTSFFYLTRTIIELRQELVQLEHRVEEMSRIIQMEEFNAGQCVTSAQKLYRQNEEYLIAAKVSIS